MPYIPKSQYNIKYTNGGELYNPTTGEEYSGEYIQYGQKYFAGNTITNLKVKLKKIDKEDNIIVKNTRNFLYNQLNPKHYKNIKKRLKPVASKPQPTEEDYNKGVWRRYFCQRVNNPNDIFELDIKGYNKLLNGEYDKFLYYPGEIMWSLRSIEINTNNILKLVKKYPNIQFFFNNPGEFIE